jgi:hypothetical protein
MGITFNILCVPPGLVPPTEAETDVTQEAPEIIGRQRQADANANINEGPRIMELAIGDRIPSETRIRGMEQRRE